MDGIVAAALRITDREGLDALSMRRLGAALRVDPMAIYHHVPDKDALLQVLVGAVFARMDLSLDPAAPWRERVAAWARAYRDLIRRHPSFVLQITSNAAAVHAAATLVGQPLYAALSDAGLSDALVVGVADTLVDFIHGHSLAAVGARSRGAPAAPRKRRADATTSPVPARVVRAPTVDRSLEDGFATGLTIIVEGVLALHAAART